jgi:hypothetical protein
MSSATTASALEQLKTIAPKDIVNSYFTELLDTSHAKFKVGVTQVVCRCGVVRQGIKSTSFGYTNLSSHVLTKHCPMEICDCVSEVHRAALGSNSTITAFFAVTEKAKSIYGWLDMVVDANLPFSYVENKTVRKYSALLPNFSHNIDEVYGVSSKGS